MSNKLSLVLLFGGQSCEHEVSVTSARSMLAAIDDDRYDLTLVGITRSGRWVLPEDLDRVLAERQVVESDGAPVYLDYCGDGHLKSPTDATLDLRVDVVFPVLHGPNGEDGTIQGLLDLAGIAYVGSGVVGSAVSMDKEMMRRAFAAEGLEQTAWLSIRGASWRGNRSGEIERCVSALDFPMFVKPCNLGSSVGISKAHNPDALADAIDFALGFDYKVMVEQSVENALEIECAVLGNDSAEASPLGEIIPGAEFYNYETKYIDDKSQLVIPANIDDDLADAIRQVALRAFYAVEAAGLSRVDFLIKPQQASVRIIINEINTIPGFTPISMYPKLWQEAGISYAELIDRLVELAIARHEELANRTNDLDI
ncbi:MAG: D-alanine--D-alanine ligase A [marine bacterium B5-7]|nr:MAG: D-alanine--D-alanine ligase A [marine bacterium B5-7]